MWLNPLKGAHLTLGQLDKTLPVDMSAVATVGGKSVKVNEAIERGSIVFIKAGTTGKDTACFQLYTSAEAKKANAVPYVALMGVKDFQAGMAGTNGQAPGNDPTVPGSDKGTPAASAQEQWLRTPPAGTTGIVGVTGPKGPRITAISLVQPAEWQTDAYDTTVDTYYVGMPLTVNDEGKLTPFDAEDASNIVGYVTAIPEKRWINNLGASADGARISGGYAKVLAFSTAWIPVAATAGNTGALKVGAPKVVSTAADAAKAAAAAEAPKGPEAHAGLNRTQGK